MRNNPEKHLFSSTLFYFFLQGHSEAFARREVFAATDQTNSDLSIVLGRNDQANWREVSQVHGDASLQLEHNLTSLCSQ